MQSNRSTYIAIIIGSLMFTYWLVIPVVLGGYAERDGFKEDQLGLIASAYSAGIFFTTLTGAFWIQRCSQRATLACGAIISSLGFTGLCFASTLVWVVVNALLASIGLGIAYSVVMIILGASPHPARAFALLFFLQVVLGVIGNTTLTMGLSGDAIIKISSISMILIGLICAAIVPLLSPIPRPITGHGGLTAKRLLPTLPVTLGLLSILLVFTGDAGVWVFLERIGAQHDGTSLGGSLVSTNLIAGAVGSLTAAWLSERWGYLYPMIIAIALSILSAILFNQAGTPVLLLIASFINGWAWNFGAAYRMGLVSKLDPAGHFVVLIPSMQTLGNAIGPLLIGWIIVSNSYAVAYWVVSALWMLALMAYWPAWRHQQAAVRA